MFSPEFDAFARSYDDGEPSLVSLKLVADLETPVSAFMKLSAGRGGDVFLLESVEGGAARGRYSMIGLNPDVIFRVKDGKAEINRDVRRNREAFAPCDTKPLDALRALLDESAIPAGPGLPPMAAGVFGYLGYDMVREMERLASAKPDPIGTPDALLVRPTLMAVFDSVRDEIWLVTPVRPRPRRRQGAYEKALERLEARGGRRWKARCATRPRRKTRCCCRPRRRSPTPREARYLAMVEQAKSYIRAGDIFQVVLSQRFTSPFQLPAFALYRALRRVNPAPFLCYLDFGAIPDRLLQPGNSGARARGQGHHPSHRRHAPARRDPGGRRHLAEELLADPKERAEHLMLLDLGRNDVGRVAETGTVEVTEKFVIERYSHVMHIVSNVMARSTRRRT